MSLPPLPVEYDRIDTTFLGLTDNTSTPKVPTVSTLGNLYKKTGDDNLYWATLGGGESALGSGGGGGSTFVDTAFRITSSADVTAQQAFDLSSISTGTTRTISCPDTAAYLPAVVTGTDASIFLTGELKPRGSATGNVSIGWDAFSGATGEGNTSLGYAAAPDLLAGEHNVLIGMNVCTALTSGSRNTSIGVSALASITDDVDNVAVGYQALAVCTTSGHTAVGSGCMSLLNNGIENVSVGFESQALNVGGSFNTSVGYRSLAACVAGTNTAIGSSVLASCTSGLGNTAVGAFTLAFLTTSFSNTVIGSAAGNTITTETNNILLGAGADIVASADYSICVSTYNTVPTDHTTWIGFSKQPGGTSEPTEQCYIDGIVNAQTVLTSPVNVQVGTNGLLGIVVSSIKYKSNVADLNGAERAYDLRPVEFTYKKDPNQVLQYGLIAEEVLEIIPELVVLKNGAPETVQYSRLVPILLDLVQKLNDRIIVLEASAEL